MKTTIPPSAAGPHDELDQMIDGMGKPAAAQLSQDDHLDSQLDSFVRDERLQEEHGTPLEQLKTLGEGALEGATLGLGTGLETSLFNNEKEIRDRREANPGSHMVGQIAGVAGPALFGDEAGVAGLLSNAGNAGVKALGLGAAESAAGRIAASGVKNAIEAAIFQGGDEVSKMFSQDPAYAGKLPSEAAETALINVGLGGLLGGLIGGGMGASSELWKATVGKRLGTALETASHEIQSPHSADILKTQVDEFGTPIQAPEDSGPYDLISSEMKNLKPNLDQLTQDAQELGVNLTEGMKSGSKFIQNVEGNLIKNPTYAGQAVYKETKAVFDGLEKGTRELLRDATLKSEPVVGREVKGGVYEVLEQELKPIEESFDELKPTLKKTPVTMGDIMQASSRILDHEYANLESMPELRKTAVDYVNRIKGLKNLDEVKTFRTIVSERLDQAMRTDGGGPEAQILKEVKNSLTDLRQMALESAAARGDIPADAFTKITETDAAYAAYKKKLQDLGVEGGLGRVGSARQLLEKFSKLSDESFATKLFDLNDVNQLEFVKKTFPKEYELSRRYKLRDIFEKSVSDAQGKNGAIDLRKFLTQVSDKNMNPEARVALFGENGSQKIDAIRRLYGAMPADPNPSGTGAAILFSKLLSREGFLTNMSDGAKYALLKARPYLDEASAAAGGGKAGELAAATMASQVETGVDPSAFQQMAKFIGKAVKGENILNRATKEIFDAGTEVLPSKLIPSERDREKLDEQLKEAQVKTDSLFEASGSVGHYMPLHGMAISQTAMGAVNYLNSLRPVAKRLGPLDKEFQLSKTELAPFYRALDIANQPLIVLQSAKDGTINHTDVVHFQKLYPSLYERTGRKLHTNILDSVSKGATIPYKTRMGLSMFLAQPLDGTMLPSSIQAAQPKAPGQKAAAQGPQPLQNPKHSMKALNQMPLNSMTADQARQRRLLKQ